MRARLKEMLTGKRIVRLTTERATGSDWGSGKGTFRYDGIVDIELEDGYHLRFTPQGNDNVAIHVWSPKGSVLT
jgi:hypothetical protein